MEDYKLSEIKEICKQTNTLMWWKKKEKKTTGIYKDKKDFREKHCQMCSSFVCSDMDDEYADGCNYLKSATFEKDEWNIIFIEEKIKC